MGVKTAFFTRVLVVETCMGQVEVFVKEGRKHLVCKLNKGYTCSSNR